MQLELFKGIKQTHLWHGKPMKSEPWKIYCLKSHTPEGTGENRDYEEVSNIDGPIIYRIVHSGWVCVECNTLKY